MCMRYTSWEKVFGMYSCCIYIGYCIECILIVYILDIVLNVDVLYLDWTKAYIKYLAGYRQHIFIRMSCFIIYKL